MIAALQQMGHFSADDVADPKFIAEKQKRWAESQRPSGSIEMQDSRTLDICRPTTFLEQILKCFPEVCFEPASWREAPVRVPPALVKDDAEFVPDKIFLAMLDKRSTAFPRAEYTAALGRSFDRPVVHAIHAQLMQRFADREQVRMWDADRKADGMPGLAGRPCSILCKPDVVRDGAPRVRHGTVRHR